jgi:antitoxin VapB
MIIFGKIIQVMAFEAIEIKQKKGIQEIRIPERLKIKGGKVYLKKVGNSLYIIPFNEPWQNLIDSLDLFTPDFMETRDQPEDQQRESFDI